MVEYLLADVGYAGLVRFALQVEHLTGRKAIDEAHVVGPHAGEDVHVGLEILSQFLQPGVLQEELR